MSYFTVKPLARLASVRQKVFGEGAGASAAEAVMYARGDIRFKVKAVPRALRGDVADPVRFQARGWLVDSSALAANGIDRPAVGDAVEFHGERWAVFDAGDGCFDRRDYGDRVMVFTKLTTGKP